MTEHLILDEDGNVVDVAPPQEETTPDPNVITRNLIEEWDHLICALEAGLGQIQDMRNRYENALQIGFRQLPYNLYLHTKHWQRVRERTLQRASYRCQMCSKSGSSYSTRQRGDVVLEVHHNTYSNLGNERDEDLIVLCSDCHRRHHGKELRA